MTGVLGRKLQPTDHPPGHPLVRLERAREEGETVHLGYFTASRGEWNGRDVNPYHLHFVDGTWYVFAYCHWRKEVKVFAPDRVGSVEGTPEAFLAHSFEIERGDPVDVAIRFGPEQARYVRGKQWHPSQSIEELGRGPDGKDQGLLLRMHVGGLGEVKRWVLSFGAGAEVLKPQSLRLEVIREIESLGRNYRPAV